MYFSHMVDIQVIMMYMWYDTFTTDVCELYI